VRRLRRSRARRGATLAQTGTSVSAACATACSQGARRLCNVGTAGRMRRRPGRRRVAVNVSAGIRDNGKRARIGSGVSTHYAACDPVAWRRSCHSVTTPTGQRRPSSSTMWYHIATTRRSFGTSSTIGNHSVRRVTRGKPRPARDPSAST
jgi:hypothetical protein